MTSWVRGDDLKGTSQACTKVCEQVVPVRNIGVVSKREAEASGGLVQCVLEASKERPTAREGGGNDMEIFYEPRPPLVGGTAQAREQLCQG